jgi:hypothetical protein
MEVKDYFACHELQFTRRKLDVNKGCRCLSEIKISKWTSIANGTFVDLDMSFLKGKLVTQYGAKLYNTTPKHNLRQFVTSVQT